MVGAVPASYRRRLLALTAAGLLARLLWVALEPETYPVADETMWVAWGSEKLLSPEVAFSPLRLRFIFHPPLYLYFVGVPFALLGSLLAVKVAQAFASALLVPAVGLAGRRAFGEPAGLVAAGIAAFYPELVWFASHFWAETVFTVLLWWAIERLIAADALGSAKAAAATKPARSPKARRPARPRAGTRRTPARHCAYFTASRVPKRAKGTPTK